MTLQSIVQPTSFRPKSQGRRNTKLQQLFNILAASLTVSSWVLLGAIAQGSIFLIYPRIITLLPAVSIILFRTIDTCLMALNLKKNIYMTDVIPNKYTALSMTPSGVPEPAGTGKIAILFLGAKSNHPFGFFGPGFSQLGAYLGKMLAELDANATSAGFLGTTNWTRKDERGAIELVNIMYWKDLASIHEFAHSPLHREAWAWWEATLKEHHFMGINHEIYEADGGAWETIYANFQPTGYAATSHFVRDGGKLESGVVSDQWIAPLVEANRGKLARSSGRLGWEPTKHDEKHARTEGLYV